MVLLYPILISGVLFFTFQKEPPLSIVAIEGANLTVPEGLGGFGTEVWVLGGRPNT